MSLPTKKKRKVRARTGPRRPDPAQTKRHKAREKITKRIAKKRRDRA